jgi:hypothetical protein
MKRKRIPDLMIEQYLLGELPADEVAEVEASEGFADRIATLRRSNEEILAAYPPEQFALRILNRHDGRNKRASSAARTRRFTRTRWLSLAIPGAIAAVAGFVFLLQGPLGGGNGSDDANTEVVRLKGSDAEISIYRAVTGTTRTSDAERLSNGDTAVAGDELQIAYNPGAMHYGMIVSVDGRGTVMLHFPVVQSDEPELQGGTHRLPFAYTLDDAPNYENFYFIVADELFSVREVLDRIRVNARQFVGNPDMEIGITGDYDVVAFTIRKGE